MAKNAKGGLGRGLNSLMGGYEALTERVPAREKQAPRTRSEKNEAVQEAEEAPRVVEREVIREENLTQEDRAVIDREKKEYPAPLRMPDQAASKSTRRDAFVQAGFDGDDGITIKGVVERPARVSTPRDDVAAAVLESSSAAPGEEAAAQESPVLTTSHAVGSEESKAMDEVDIEKIHPNPDQPRMHFNEDELEELAASIEKDGLLQPILVREVEQGYEIIAGERRWRACQRADLKKVPIRIKEADDMKVLELALIENLQRSDMNPIEEAYGYKRMMEHGGRTQAEVASAVSKGRSTIANALRLLELPEEAQQLLYEERITAGHARAILSIQSDEGRRKLTDKLRDDKLSVRETEAIARLIVGRENASKKPPKPPAPALYKTAARSLKNTLQTNVRIRSANGKNKIEIEFKDEDDLQRIFDKMNNPE